MSKALRMSSLLPLLVLICSYQISVAACANPATPVLDASALSSRSIEGTDSSSETKERPSQDRDDSPEPARDIDECEGGLDDLEPANFSRTDQGILNFSFAAPDARTLRASTIIRVFLLSVNCSPRLREHIRERAPPTLT